MLNNVCLNGRLTKECELEQVGKSDKVASFNHSFTSFDISISYKSESIYRDFCKQKNSQVFLTAFLC